MDALDSKFEVLFHEDSTKDGLFNPDKFEGNDFLKKCKDFTRDEWISILLRSMKLNEEYIDSIYNDPDTSKGSISRLKLHFLARLLPLVVRNFNFLEIGNKATGKSYIYSELSHYSCFLNSGSVSQARLFFNNATNKVGEIGLWDNIVLDEMNYLKFQGSTIFQMLLDYMANGRFSIGKEDIVSTSSLSFLGNFENQQNSSENPQLNKAFFIFPEIFNTAFYDRIHFSIPGNEMPRISPKLLTEKEGFSFDQLSEIFHFLFKSDDIYTKTVKEKMRLSPSIGFRNEWAIKKTVTGLIKIIYPNGDLSTDEFNELLTYAIEGRQRIIEQLSLKNPEDFDPGVFVKPIQ